ncbi:helix-turn-helix domain-containing protein [Paracholeplasma manati]|uniref:helix-turn-helix domain-containing protein n=1 Tax=Paracholeplasma manati TaxID=591373 RepID=UPI00240837D3|nr:helix-turn-helix transcriptional regulator [Paracholeplasma manati]MDG0889237.1 helix-turn-helix transcriptional regulator [Paracholeplasma manati]
MRYSYNNLWKLLIDNHMKKKDLEVAAHIASSTIAKMSKELPVTLDVLGRICEVLKCNIGDILEIIY